MFIGIRSRLVLLGLLASVVCAVAAAPAFATKEYVSGGSFGGQGSEAGKLEGPQGVAVNDRTGNIYVADAGNNRVDEFSENRAFVRAWGWGVNGSPGFGECTLTCQAGESGSGKDELESASGIAVDNSAGPSEEAVYVEDPAADRIDKFTAEGAPQGEIAGTCENTGETPPSCKGFADFNELRAITVDPSGNLWVYEVERRGEGHGVLSEFDGEGKFVKQFPTGWGAQVVVPGTQGIAADGEGRVYILMSYEEIVQAFNAETGEELGEDYKEYVESSEENPVALAVNPTNNDLLVDVGLRTKAAGEKLELYAPLTESTQVPRQVFPASPEPALVESHGVAVNGASGAVYASEHGSDEIAVFTKALFPEVSPSSPSGMSGTSVTLNGSVGRPGEPIAECAFEYISGTGYEQNLRNEVQTVTVAGAAGGEFGLSYESNLVHFSFHPPSGEAGVHPSASEVQQALEGISAIHSGNVKVSSSITGSDVTYRIEFVKGLADREVPAIAATSQLDPAGATVTSEVSVLGSSEGFAGASEAPCQPSTPFAGTATVEAQLQGLKQHETYRYRLTAVNEAGLRSTSGAGNVFTSTAPGIEAESSLETGSSEATVDASIDPEGLPSTYRVEYGPTEAYGYSTPEAALGSSTDPVPVTVRLSGLLPATEYHFRFVASNTVGSTGGADATFATAGATGPVTSGLPDHRVYELVSSPTDNQDVYSLGGVQQGGARERHNGLARQPFLAADNGNSVAYAGYPALEGGNGAISAGFSNEFLASRGADGWSSRDVTPAGTDPETEYLVFSDDLSTGVFTADNGAPIAASPVSPASCTGDLYSLTADGGYHALIGEPDPHGSCGEFLVPTFSGDGSHLAFEDSAALTPGAEEGQTTQSPYILNGGYNIYDSVAGTLYQVNVLPDGKAEQAPVAWLGAPPFGQYGSSNSDGAVSANGSRIVWTSNELYAEGKQETWEYRPKALYVRENDTQPQSPLGPNGECTSTADACTVQLDRAEPGCIAEGECQSGAGLFWAASVDGSRVFFTDCKKLTKASFEAPEVSTTGCIRGNKKEYGNFKATGEDLYEYDSSTGRLTDLTIDHHPGDTDGANVQGVLGTSEDGAYVYFVAGGVLAENENARKEKAQSVECGEGISPCNLYLWHEGTSTFIAQLDAEDNELPSSGEDYGDWRPASSHRTAEVTPDGGDLLFESKMKLTGYDSGDKVSHEDIREAFVYDAQTDRISCVSCVPSGAPPSSPQFSGASYLPLPGGAGHGTRSYTEHWMSDSGARVFFETSQALLPQDVNGQDDVYEWERPASGTEENNTCTTSSSSFSAVDEGCVYLISGGQSSDSSFFSDTDAEGNNVFLTSRGRLTPQAKDENFALYDARVDGGFPELATECTGTGCQGVPAAPPVFATPSSVTFDGIGNFPPPAPAKHVVKQKRKQSSSTRAQRLAHALRVCARDRSAHRRAACERRARKRIGATRRVKVSSNRGRAGR
ncbi:MAG TPA: hypothetical protein VMU32_12670 [Solirubrobacteraceae bacterium]|nr:hypothetical protein [Solirubrobacteraceae bacterium]